MATIRPFKAVRPRGDLGGKIAALPYDVMNTDEAREMVKGNPYSFLHIDRGEIDLPIGTDPHDKAVYAKARENFDGMIKRGEFIQDDAPCFYIYRLIMDGRAQTGLAVTASVKEYENGIIKKHEKTRADKEQDRIDHVKTVGAHTGPIFLAYRYVPEITAIINKITENAEPLYDFEAEDGIRHTVWKVAEKADIARLAELFENVPNLYIADGHHRNASAARVAAEMRADNKNHTGNEGYNYYLAVLFPDNDLKILDYNRVVTDLNGMTAETFMAKINELFTASPENGADDAKPKEEHTFGMYFGGKWYALKPKFDVPDDCIAGLDVSVLYDKVLSPLLGIGDIRTDKRIDFVGGIRGLGELERRVDSGEMAVAFAMYPTTMAQLFTVADEGEIMPPKSTWFEPKLRSGLLIHMLDD